MLSCSADVWNGRPDCVWTLPSGRSVTVQQNYAAQRVWSEFFRQRLDVHDPISMTIEIGTARGGFTAFLHEYIPYVVTHDICVHPERVTLPRVTYVVQDVFEQYRHDHISLQCASSDRKLLICDGGNKPREIQTFTPYLNVGDYVAVHDYDMTRSTQRERRCWGWCECTVLDVPTERLTPVFGFQQTGWGVFEVRK